MKELCGKMPDGTEIYAHTIADGDISREADGFFNEE